MQRELGAELLIRQSAEVLHLIRILPGHLLLKVLWGHPTGKRLGGRPETPWRERVYSLAWEQPGGWRLFPGLVAPTS